MSGPASETTTRETIARERDEELVMHLERDQLVAEKRRPVPRAELSRRAAAGLWALRIAVVVFSTMVLYAFVERLA